jgi:hypothetical protein
MAGKTKSRAKRAEEMRARMPSVPGIVVDRMVEAFMESDFKRRGVTAAIERFFRRLRAENLAFEMVREEDFAAVCSSRSGFRALVWALEEFAPEVPLTAAHGVKCAWDRWLNEKYNAKPKKHRSHTRIALLPDEWPSPWRAALPSLDTVVRVDGTRFAPKRGKGRENVIQAVGMLWASRAWAMRRGIDVEDRLTSDLVEVFTRFLLDPDRATGNGKGPVSPISAIAYLERVRSFARRSGLLSCDADAQIRENLGALRGLQFTAAPGKRKRLHDFRRQFSLADIMHEAIRRSEHAKTFPAFSSRARQLRREAMVIALLVNTADRQGDLSRFVVGRELKREDGAWSSRFVQSKTLHEKDQGALWPITSRLIDEHLFGDRPTWTWPDLLAELDGKFVVSAADEPMGLYYPTAVMTRSFSLSGHLLRTLITDAIRVERPDASWAAQFMLGHRDPRSQQYYRSDFRIAGTIDRFHQALADLA